MKINRYKKIAVILIIGMSSIICTGFSSKPVLVEDIINKTTEVSDKNTEGNKEDTNKEITKTANKKELKKEQKVETTGTPKESKEDSPEEAVFVCQNQQEIVEESNNEDNNLGDKKNVNIQETVKEEASEAVVVCQNQQEIVEEVKQVENPAIKYHSVIEYGYAEERVAGSFDILNKLRTGNRFFTYYGNNISTALGSILQDYCALDQSYGLYYDNGNGNYEIEESVWPTLYDNILRADQKWANYKGYVAAACQSLNLYTTDEDLVNQINEYICRNFDYAITNQGNMPNFVSTKQGQCWHYAKLFADMCNAVGISCSKIENTEHAWDVVNIEGKSYTFDCTYNDTSNNWTAYSWR